MSTSTSPTPNGFAFLLKEAARRFRRPVGQTSFWVYLILAVIGLGGLAIFIEGWRYYRGGPSMDAERYELALYTVFAAIMGSSAVQLALDKDNSPIRNAGILILATSFVGSFALISTIGSMSDRLSIAIGIAAFIFSVMVWWIANGDEPMFQDVIRPDSSVGGDIHTPLEGGPGDVQT